MTTSVDVIALLHEVELSLMIDGRSEERRQLVDARAAVADLIEAAALLEKSAVEHSRFLASVYTNKLNRLRDALARVKGA